MRSERKFTAEEILSAIKRLHEPDSCGTDCVCWNILRWLREECLPSPYSDPHKEN